MIRCFPKSWITSRRRLRVVWLILEEVEGGLEPLKRGVFDFIMEFFVELLGEMIWYFKRGIVSLVSLSWEFLVWRSLSCEIRRNFSLSSLLWSLFLINSVNSFTVSETLGFASIEEGLWRIQKSFLLLLVRRSVDAKTWP